MKDLYDLLETRCFDIFEIKVADASHNKQAILARGNLVYYFSKVSTYLTKVFGCGFDIDWNYVPRKAFCSMFSYIEKNYGSLKVEKKDGVQYYFGLAKDIWDYLSDYSTVLETPFVYVKSSLINRMPVELCNARLFINGEMTMAGLIYFMAPLLSVNDRYRLIDDVTRIFAKDISFYQGEHCDKLYDTILDFFPKSTMFAEFEPFFEDTPKTPLEQLSRILFSDKARYASIDKEGENKYSFDLDLSGNGIYQPLVLKGTIEESEDSFTINMNPYLCKYDFLFDEQNCSLTLKKAVLGELSEYARRIPAFVVPLSLAFFFREDEIDVEVLRSLGPSFFFFQCGSYYYDDRDRSDIAYKPLYRAGFCTPSFLYIFLNVNKAVRNNLINQMEKVDKDITRKIADATTHSNWLNLLWKYDLLLGGDFMDERSKESEVSITSTALAKYLVEMYDLFLEFDDMKFEFNEENAVLDYAIRGIRSFTDVMVTKKYSNELYISKKILDPLSQTERDWHSSITNKSEDEDGYAPAKLITEESLEILSTIAPMIDTWLLDSYNGNEYSQRRYAEKITRVHITSQSESIMIKGRDTGEKEMTLTVIDESELNGITGRDGSSLTMTKQTDKYSFLVEKEMVC